MAIRIVTDSTAGLTREFVEEMNVKELPLYFRFDDEVFVENDMDLEEFYKKMDASPSIPATSQPSYLQVYQTYEELLKQGHEVIGIFISSAFTGPYNLSRMVLEELQENYPDSRVELIDSKMAAMGLGYPVQEAAKAAAAGVAFDEIVKNTRNLLENAHVVFVPETLENLKKGGRIGSAAALLGSLLEIKPLLVLQRGKVEVLKKCRGNKSAEEAMLRVLMKDAKDFGIIYIVVHYCHALERGRHVWQMVYDRLGLKSELDDLSPVIAIHAGEGTVGIAYFTERHS